MFGKHHNESQPRKPLKVIFFVLVFVALMAAAAYVVMLLWNAILPDTLGVKPLNYWKAAGLLLLAKLLFGGFRRRSGWKNGKRKEWKNKWMNMSPEERKEAKSRWKAHCKKRLPSDASEEL